MWTICLSNGKVLVVKLQVQRQCVYVSSEPGHDNTSTLKMGLCQFHFMIICLFVFYDSVVSQYNVRISAVSEIVNQGDDYVAHCNIPDKGALDIIQNLQVWWFHNGKPLTSLCEMLRPELATKYSCKLLSPQAQNISFELTISDIKPEDAGNVECDVLKKIEENGKWVRDEIVANKQVMIEVRDSVVSQYNVRISAVSEIVNQGDDYVAHCNIPDKGALDIIQNLQVWWFHNGKPLTSRCEMLRPELILKYSCKVLSPQAQNISLELTISDIKPEDAGNLECDVLEKIVENGKWVRDEPVAKKQVKIQMREPIKSMVFKFDSTTEEALTLDNNEAPHRMDVLPGQYSPSCTVEGSNPLADVKIMKGDVQLPGRVVDISGTSRTLFLADASEFKGNTQTNVMCSSEVPGLPNSKMERTYQIVVRKMDPKFECSNESAIVNNKRHKITCQVYGVEGIMCNKVMWQRGDDGMNYQLGNHQNINIGCQQVDDSTLQTTLEILQVTSEDFKTPFRVVYSDRLAGTNVHQISIPQDRN
ncbi:uncharacterized protein LOC144617788 isoform X2 [Crassostrea virginica]